MVAEGWREKTLDQAGIAVIDGDRGAAYPNGDDFSGEGHCLFLSAKNVTSEGFSFSTRQFINEEKHQQMRKGTLAFGDIVLTTRGTVGNTAFFDGSVPYATMRINSGMVLVRNQRGEIDQHFLSILFRSPVIQKQIERLTFGSAQPQLTVGIIKGFKVPLPPLAEQKRIAEVLGVWDRAIAVAGQQLDLARTQKRALMQTLLTPTRRFPGFDGQPWKEVRLGDVADIRKGTQKSKSTLDDQGDYPVINGGITASGYTDEWNTEADTITISEGGNSCGFVNRIRVRFWSGGHCYTLEDLKAEKDFLFHVLKFGEADIMRLRVGSGLPNIQKKAISGYAFGLPPVAEQRAIAAVLNDALAEEVAHETQITRLQAEKKALMQQLLTGKKRLAV